MAFTFDPAITEQRDLVRLHIGDTDEEGHFIEDETIEYLLEQGTLGSAVIASIKVILAKLSAPDFKLDWMSVSGMDKAREGFENLLLIKEAEFGLQAVRMASVVSHPYRADSPQDPDEHTYREEFE